MSSATEHPSVTISEETTPHHVLSNEQNLEVVTQAPSIVVTEEAPLASASTTSTPQNSNHSNTNDKHEKTAKRKYRDKYYEGKIRWQEKIKRPKEEGDDSEEEEGEPGAPRVPKRKYILLLGYCGTGYQGMQRNPGAKTLEDDIVDAIFKAGGITLSGKNELQKIRWQRTARTDKGVHAARQVVSFKMNLIENPVAAINAHLPPQIRVFHAAKVTKRFDCKLKCDARRYEYLAPTFCFAPQELGISADYRITPEVLSRTRDVMNTYLGTHNFHNFTSKKFFNDPSALRYMMNIQVGEPFIGADGVEWVSILIKGQSFMLHQIRKMIGLAMAVVKGIAPENTITRSWLETKLDIPMAPGLGLCLDSVYFETYNERLQDMNGEHEALVWDRFDPEVLAFKDAFIYKEILGTEQQTGEFRSWIEALKEHTFEATTQPKGTYVKKPKHAEEDDEGEE